MDSLVCQRIVFLQFLTQNRVWIYGNKLIFVRVKLLWRTMVSHCIEEIHFILWNTETWQQNHKTILADRIVINYIQTHV